MSYCRRHVEAWRDGSAYRGQAGRAYSGPSRHVSKKRTNDLPGKPKDSGPA